MVLLPTFVSRLATWIGTYGLSGVTMLIAGGLILLLRRRWAEAALMLVLPLAAGLVLTLVSRPAAGPPGIALRIVQPNIGQQEKWQEGFEREGKARLGRLSAGDRRRPRLLLWPEAAVTEPLENGLADAAYRIAAARLRAEVAAMLAPGDLLLTGGVTWRSTDGVNVGSATNSVFAVDPDGRIIGRYDKAHLVPYGEYLPMRPFLSALGLSRLAPGDVDFDSGPGPRSLDLPLVGKVGFQLCYEIIFSGEVVGPARPTGLHLQPVERRLVRALGPAPASRPGAAAGARGRAAGAPLDADRNLGGDRRRRTAARQPAMAPGGRDRLQPAARQAAHIVRAARQHPAPRLRPSARPPGDCSPAQSPLGAAYKDIFISETPL